MAPSPRIPALFSHPFSSLSLSSLRGTTFPPNIAIGVSPRLFATDNPAEAHFEFILTRRQARRRTRGNSRRARGGPILA
jgi:hypothetical protein